MKQAIVVGTGAGGAMAAKELQGAFQVTVLEAGGDFEPFSRNFDLLARMRKTGLFFDERMISLLFPAMRVAKSQDKGLVMVTGRATGGTTTLSTANALRYDRDLRALGIDLDEEFAELAAEVPVSIDHRKRWSAFVEQMFSACERLGFEPQVTGKFIDFKRCARCGRCVFGCRHGAKWDARMVLEDAVARGAQLRRGCTVVGLEVERGLVTGVRAKEGRRSRTYRADAVVLAAGGMGTPVILEQAGIRCDPTLFCDPVLCVAGPAPGAHMDTQLPMPFLMQRDGYMLSPYIDYLSFFFNKKWLLPASDVASMMIKLADSREGASGAHGFRKSLTEQDKARLKRAVADCKDILREMGIAEGEMFLGTVNAGHPGGMLALTANEAETLHSPRLPQNLYVADATLLPNSMGNPPILTIMALAKRVARNCVAACG